MYTDDPNYNAALKFVNEIRERYHQPPLTKLVAGYVCSADSCVISKSLQDCSVCGEVSTTPGYTRVMQFGVVVEVFETSPEVQQFIIDFDQYKYPSLELRRWEL